MKRERLVVGLMSGTSLDGIDAVLLRVRGAGPRTTFSQMAHRKSSFPRGLKQRLLDNSFPLTSRVDDICRLNMLLAGLYADAVKGLLRAARVKASAIECIGSHGQTIQHLPQPARMYGKTIRSTLQIGDPSVIATLTGIPTVGNFRPADMAVGGEGAPLVPYFDWLTLRSARKERLLINIGGIANITYLPVNCKPSDVVAFDTGPGNMVVDALMEKLFGRRFDRNGAVARRGSVDTTLFRWLSGHRYLKRPPPKSTGREEFGDLFVEETLKRSKKLHPEDIVATVSTFTPWSIHHAVTRYRRRFNGEVIVSGGGARNGCMMDQLKRLFAPCTVTTSDALGIPGDAKEATCFAILAHETLAGVATNLPSVTGARHPVILGTVTYPQIKRRVGKTA